jgi:DNA (cytosine-5)-methyltransferase 1
MMAVDLFAGWGGMTLGAERAGARVAWAANHWPLAVETHRRNHPGAEHSCQDLRQADWTALPEYELLLAGPACQGHSNASQPRRRGYHDALRATAWAVVDCAEVTRPAALVVENVVAFRRWGLFDLWCEALGRLGYRLSIDVVRASRLGVPQRRDRLFVAGVRSGRAVDLSTGDGPEPAFRPCLDGDAGGWKRVAECRYPKAQARMRRVASELGTGIAHHVTDCPVVSLDAPLPTITTKHQWALVAGEWYRPVTTRELARGMGFPDSFGWSASVTDATRGLGNAVVPAVAEHVVRRTMAAA